MRFYRCYRSQNCCKVGFVDERKIRVPNQKSRSFRGDNSAFQ